MHRLTGVLAAVVVMLGIHGAAALTPKDTLVMAWAIDDIISLDPAEIFEFSTAEIAGNSYDRLIGYDVGDVSKIFGVVAESWTVSEDGRTFKFQIRPGITFASGHPLTAEDVAFSLQRAVILDKSPAFILGQFGLTPANARDKIRQTGPMTVELETDQAYAPTFVLYCLTATVSSVVDKALVMAHEKDGDLGYAWLKTNYAGSGPMAIAQWRANEAVVLERNPNYWGPRKPSLERVILLHIPEPTTQQLMLEKGDIDIARKLEPQQLATVEQNPGLRVRRGVKGTLYYLGLNQKNQYLAKPQVRQALKYLVDYQAIADTIMRNKAIVHQAFLPKGFLGALEENPFSLDVAKAKALLAEAGLPDGFRVTMDTRNTADVMGMAQAMQATFALAGVTLEILPADYAQTLTKYRARNHDIHIGRWGPDYQDPHTNADTFAANPDNADGAAAKPLAWRNAWNIPEMTEVTRSAVLERDAGKRADLYRQLQVEHQQVSPFVILFQEVEVLAERQGVDGFVIGPSFDDNKFAFVTK